MKDEQTLLHEVHAVAVELKEGIKELTSLVEGHKEIEREVNDVKEEFDVFVKHIFLEEETTKRALQQRFRTSVDLTRKLKETITWMRGSAAHMENSIRAAKKKAFPLGRDHPINEKLMEVLQLIFKKLTPKLKEEARITEELADMAEDLEHLQKKYKTLWGWD